MENDKHPLDNLKNDEITKKREKCEMHTEGREIWNKRWFILEPNKSDHGLGTQTQVALNNTFHCGSFIVTEQEP